MVERADMRSWLCMERVRHAPFCKDELCRQRYAFRSKYHESTGRTSYWWQCPNWKHHGAKNCPRESPDFGLPEALLRFAKKERANRDRDVLSPKRKTPRRGKFGKRLPTWKRPGRKTVST